MRSKRLIYFFGALGGILFGYDTGVISGAVLFIKQDFQMSSFMQGAVVSFLLLGAMVGAGTAGRLADRLGRRRLILIAAVYAALPRPQRRGGRRAERARPGALRRRVGGRSTRWRSTRAAAGCAS